MATMTGGCLCGAVRFAVTGAPKRMVACHCADCRKLSGGGPAFLVGVPETAFEITEGAPAAFVVVGGTGKPVTRWFCATCGAPLHSRPEAYAETLYVKVGAFDADPGFRAQASVHLGGAPDWHRPAPDAPRFDGAP